MTHDHLVSTVIATVLCTAAMGCASMERRPAGGPAGPAASPTLAPSIHYEEGQLLFLGVNLGPARLSLDAELLPMDIAIANKSLPELTVTLEGLTLNGGGASWPAAAPRERAGKTLRAEFEKSMMPVQFEEIARLRFATFQRVPVNDALGADPTLSRPLTLGKRQWAIVRVWFPNPGGGLAGRTFEVRFRAPELDDTFFVRIAF